MIAYEEYYGAFESIFSMEPFENASKYLVTFSKSNAYTRQGLLDLIYANQEVNELFNYASLMGVLGDGDFNSRIDNFIIYLSKLTKEEEKVVDADKDIQASLEEQAEAYKEIIDYRKELLKTYKDELDYQNELLKKQKDVSKLQTRLAVARLDTSAAGQARVRDIEAELSSAQDSLNDYTLSHAIEVVTADIDKQYKEYEAFIDGKINKIISVITASSQTPPVVAPSVSMTLNIDKVTEASLSDLRDIVDGAVKKMQGAQLSALNRTGKFNVKAAPHLG